MFIIYWIIAFILTLLSNTTLTPYSLNIISFILSVSLFLNLLYFLVYYHSNYIIIVEYDIMYIISILCILSYISIVSFVSRLLINTPFG